MQVDEPGAIAMWIPTSLMFTSNDCTFLVLHKTAGFHSAQECAAYFQRGADGRRVSSHHVVGQDGAIVQCVPENQGAGGNCCVEVGHADFIPSTWGSSDNGNLHSISVEHVDPAPDNSTPLTDAQKRASFTLVKHICERHNIPKRRARNDGQGGIIGHFDIDPITKARCPGNYPWSDLWSFLGGQAMGAPAGWKDDGTLLHNPHNAFVVQRGFRDFILAHAWPADNYPMENEHAQSPLEESNPGEGSGTQQIFRFSMLGWTAAQGVFVESVGQELEKVRQELAALRLTAVGGSDATAKKIATQAIALLQQI